MDRRRSLFAIPAVIYAIGIRQAAAQAAKVYRIGLLEIEPARANRANMDALLRGLKEAGYVEGKNLVIDYRAVEGRPERLPDLAAELIRAKPDIIVTRGSPATLAVKAVGSVPIVMAATADPVAAGIVKNLAHPGGNVTGLTNLVADLGPKRMEILRQIVPAGSRIGVLMNMGNPVNVRVWKGLETGAKAAGLVPILLDVRDANALDQALQAAKAQGITALEVDLEGVTMGRRGVITSFAAQHRLPAVYSAREAVDAGGLMSYGADYPHLYYRVASYIDKILKGAKPGDLPIEQPTKLNLVINMKAARALGLTIPKELRLRADEVIE